MRQPLPNEIISHHRKFLISVFVIMGIILFLMNLGLVYFLKNNVVLWHDLVYITNNQKEIYFDPYKTRPSYVDDYALFGTPDPKVLSATQPLLKGQSDIFTKTNILREWARRQAIDMKPETATNRINATCSAIANLYLAALHSYRIPARRVVLSQSPPFDLWDTHVAVEVFVKGRWVLQDPTFNVYWKLNGQVASAWEIRQYHLRRNKESQKIEIVSTFSPPTSYNNYYINPLILFNNVVYHYKTNELTNYTPFRLFNKNFVQLVRTKKEIRSSPFRINAIFVPLVYIYLPVSIMFLFAIGAFLKLFYRSKGRL